MSLSKVADHYCPMRAWQLSQGMIKFPEEHIQCGRKRCWGKNNYNLFDEHELKVSDNFYLVRE